VQRACRSLSPLRPDCVEKLDVCPEYVDLAEHLPAKGFTQKLFLPMRVFCEPCSRFLARFPGRGVFQHNLLRADILLVSMVLPLSELMG
jgi:hypothetical protein